MDEKCGCLVEIKRWRVYPTTYLRKLAKAIAKHGSLVLDIVKVKKAGNDKEARLAVRLFRKKRNGEREHMVYLDDSAVVLLQVSKSFERTESCSIQLFAELHDNKVRYGTLYNGYAGVIGYLAASDRLELSETFGDVPDSTLTMIQATAWTLLQAYEVSPSPLPQGVTESRYLKACTSLTFGPQPKSPRVPGLGVKRPNPTKQTSHRRSSQPLRSSRTCLMAVDWVIAVKECCKCQSLPLLSIVGVLRRSLLRWTCIRSLFVKQSSLGRRC